jgi:hypothetical protein
MRDASAGGGVVPDADALPWAGEPDDVLAADLAPSAEADGALGFAAAGRSEDSSLPSGVSPFLLSAPGLGSTLFRTTVSG